MSLVREEPVALAHQLAAQLRVVVDAAVEDDGEAELGVDHRLVAVAGQVDDGQPTVAEGHVLARTTSRCCRVPEGPCRRSWRRRPPGRPGVRERSPPRCRTCCSTPHDGRMSPAGSQPATASNTKIKRSGHSKQRALETRASTLSPHGQRFLSAATLFLARCSPPRPPSRSRSPRPTPTIQPVGTVPIPDGPAPAWIVADMDTGQILAGRDQYVTHPPASTIKTLLALVVLDELPLDATVVANRGRRQGGVQLRRGQGGPHVHRAASCSTGCCWSRATMPPTRWPHMLGGSDVAVSKMNAKAAALGRAARGPVRRRGSTVPASTDTPRRTTSP